MPREPFLLCVGLSLFTHLCPGEGVHSSSRAVTITVSFHIHTLPELTSMVAAVASVSSRNRSLFL